MAGKRVWVAGHRGMVGSAIVRRLAAEDCEVLTVDRGALDLRCQAEVEDWVRSRRPDAVFLAAATVGGIHANSTRPADFIHDNLLIGANVIHAAHLAGVSKLLFLGSSCIYPKLAPQPMGEDALLTGPLEETNQWYAIAKIAGVRLCQAYRRQHGRDFISAMPTNLYGINDNFDLMGSHVLPALLRRIHAARRDGRDRVVIWGTGSPRREFLHVDDLADACLFMMKHYSDHGPLNVGFGKDISIRGLAGLIADIVGFEGGFVFDAAKPDGPPRKALDISRLSGLGWKASIGLRDGIASTYDWFLNNHPAAVEPRE
ncbi:GDP-L-fucose synthase [Skermanella rosea]|nr:GDP-L-fucose synthase [Skermanella rosea]